MWSSYDQPKSLITKCVRYWYVDWRNGHAIIVQCLGSINQSTHARRRWRVYVPNVSHFRHLNSPFCWFCWNFVTSFLSARIERCVVVCCCCYCGEWPAEFVCYVCRMYLGCCFLLCRQSIFFLLFGFNSIISGWFGRVPIAVFKCLNENFRRFGFCSQFSNLKKALFFFVYRFVVRNESHLSPLIVTEAILLQPRRIVSIEFNAHNDTHSKPTIFIVFHFLEIILVQIGRHHNQMLFVIHITR